jgi:hypothetical protein
VKTDYAITRLLNRARGEAVAALTRAHKGSEAPATRANLAALGREIRKAILSQADRGEWSTWGITAGTDLLGLTVDVELNRGFVGPKILIHEDFKNTPLKLLQVETGDAPS